MKVYLLFEEIWYSASEDIAYQENCIGVFDSLELAKTSKSLKPDRVEDTQIEYRIDEYIINKEV